MVVIILEKVTPSLRGELSRWLMEPKPGVFIGHVSALVRDKLWEKCCAGVRGGGVFQAWSTNNEQRFEMRTYGRTKRAVIEIDGVMLPLERIKKQPAAEVSVKKQETADPEE